MKIPHNYIKIFSLMPDPVPEGGGISTTEFSSHNFILFLNFAEMDTLLHFVELCNHFYFENHSVSCEAEGFVAGHLTVSVQLRRPKTDYRAAGWALLEFSPLITKSALSQEFIFLSSTWCDCVGRVNSWILYNQETSHPK